MALVHDALVSSIADALLTAAHADGGWGYYRDHAPRVEPTVWVLTALAGARRVPGDVQAFAATHLAVLARAQRADGLLADAPRMPPNVASNGLAAALLPSTSVPGVSDTLVPRLLEGLAAVKGVKLDTQPGAAQDNALQAWPWYEDTFSWIEPTAWCMLAFKRAPDGRRPESSAARLQEAARLVRNRQCASGGWNYGNGTMLGQDLRPYVPTTAAVVLAMQDETATPDIARAVAWLSSARLAEGSTMARSMAALALHVCGHDVGDVLDALADGLPRTLERGNLHHLALALLALTVDVHNGGPLRV
jgi:hypothetical protein